MQFAVLFETRRELKLNWICVGKINKGDKTLNTRIRGTFKRNWEEMEARIIADLAGEAADAIFIGFPGYLLNTERVVSYD